MSKAELHKLVEGLKNAVIKVTEENIRLTKENKRLKKAIEDFGNNPAGFDWGVLEQLGNLEEEIDRLDAENKRLNDVDEILERWQHMIDPGTDPGEGDTHGS